jgi:hypothetical protein
VRIEKPVLLAYIAPDRGSYLTLLCRRDGGDQTLMTHLLPALLQLAALGTPPTAAAQQPTLSSKRATVVGVAGKWEGEVARVDGDGSPSNISLHFGEEFYDQNQRIKVTCDGGSLILLKDGQAHSFPCAGPDGTTDGCVAKIESGAQKIKCSREISLKFARKPGPRLVALNLRARPFHQYVSAAGGGLQAQLDDAVVPLMGEKIDFAAPLRDMDAGTYRIRFESLNDQRAAWGPFIAKWSGSAPTDVRATGIAPGLYVVSAFDSAGRATGGLAWVLVCGAKDYEQSRSTFDDATDATQHWPIDVDARAPRAYLRSVLDALSPEPAEILPQER